MAKIAGDPRAFRALVEAYQKEDAQAFQSELSKLGLSDNCTVICHWICFKECTLVCESLCPPEVAARKIDIEEMRRFAQETLKLTQDKEKLEKILEAFRKRDAKAFQAELSHLGLIQYCRQICSWFCHVECRRICRKVCPLPPLITHVGFIPTSQFTPAGYANGPNSAPPPVGLATPSPNPPGGVGDHPFGLSTQIRGIFNITNPIQYKVEFAPNPNGPWTAIDTPVEDAVYNVPKPNSPTVQNLYQFFNVFVYNRSAVGGWYSVSDMGQWSMNESYLTDWNTPPGSGAYYLRLTVKNAALQEFASSIINVHTDNENPTIALLQLSLKKPDGTVVPLDCCGGVSKGDGLIQITFQAWDENFSIYSLVAEGGCSGSIPILSRTYNGNVADKGEPVPKTILWDPWSGQNAVTETCCYLVVLSIWDRAVVNDQFSQRHGPVQSWVSIQIGA